MSCRDGNPIPDRPPSTRRWLAQSLRLRLRPGQSRLGEVGLGMATDGWISTGYGSGRHWRSSKLAMWDGIACHENGMQEDAEKRSQDAWLGGGPYG